MIQEDRNQPIMRWQLDHAITMLKKELEIDKINEQTERVKSQTKLLQMVFGGLLAFILLTSWILFLVDLSK